MVSLDTRIMVSQRIRATVSMGTRVMVSLHGYEGYGKPGYEGNSELW